MNFHYEKFSFLLCFLLLCCCTLVLQAAVVEKPIMFVNNVTGSDKYDGSAATAQQDGKTGPFATIMEAVRKAPVGAFISIANTGVDYHESVQIEGYHKGRAANPLVLDGHGATVSGLLEAPTASWTLYKDDIYYFDGKMPDGKSKPMPNSNWLGFNKHQGWFAEAEAPLIFFLNDKTAPHVQKLADIPQAGFFYDTLTSPRRLYFRLPANGKLADQHIKLPMNTGVYASDDYVVVRNMISKYSQDDGFSGFWGIGVVFENINGSYNCDQGFSMHGTSTTVIDGGLFERNAGCGIADVMSSVSIFRNIVVRDNLFAGGLFQGHAHTLLSCRFENNQGVQVGSSTGATINLVNCLINGGGKNNGITLDYGRLDHCTIVNSQTGLYVSKGVSVRNSLISNCGQHPLAFDSKIAANISLYKTIIGLQQPDSWDAYITATFGDTGAKYLKAVNKEDELIDNAPILTAPLFLLSNDSPYYKIGEFNTTPGATLKEYTGWAVVEEAGDAVPHP